MAVLPFIGLHVELEGAEELLSVEIRLRIVDRRPREPARVRAPVGMGWKQMPPAQPLLPFDPTADPKLSAFQLTVEDPVPLTTDKDPADRRGDRLMAYLGLLDDAAPLFRSGTRVSGAGVLLTLPALVQSGVFQCAREIYGSIGPAFYGPRTSILALLLMPLLRIKRPEGLKEHPPDNLGRVLGLDRAPEVKTLRRKLTRLALLGRAAEFSRELAKRRVALRGAAMGFLYVDGLMCVSTISCGLVVRLSLFLTPPCSDAITVDYRPESACLKWTFTTPIEHTCGRTGSRSKTRESPLSCPRCHKPMKVIALITNSPQLLIILRHLIKKGTPPPGLDPASLN